MNFYFAATGGRVSQSGAAGSVPALSQADLTGIAIIEAGNNCGQAEDLVLSQER
jgi:hypothetical protein